MNTLPIQLNFFRRAEQFLELIRLDKQYSQMMEEWDVEIRNRRNPDYQRRGFTFPTWNVEKKILYWTYLHHKHLATPLQVGHFDIDQYLTDWKTDRAETELCGKRQILENLEAHGFAKYVYDPSQRQVTITSSGLLAGSLLFNAYNFQQKKYGGENHWKELIPLFHKKVGYYLMYFSAWLLIFISIAFISSQFLSTVGLLDELKIYLNGIVAIKISLIVVSVLPFALLLFGILFVQFPSKEKRQG